MRLLYVSPADLQANTAVWAAVRNMGAVTITTALSNASSVADSYVSSRYATPFLSYGNDFKRAVLDIAIYDLLSARGVNLDGSDQNFRLRYEDALKWLSNVNRGIITPEGQAGGSVGGGGAVEGPGTGGGGAYGSSPRISSGRRRGW